MTKQGSKASGKRKRTEERQGLKEERRSNPRVIRLDPPGSGQ